MTELNKGGEGMMIDEPNMKLIKSFVLKMKDTRTRFAGRMLDR
jgi:hypothetical protein